MLMKRADAVKWIADNKGKDFAVRFIKKDGSIRLMNCQTGVQDTDILLPEPIRPGLDFKKLGLIGVYDMDLKQYRCFDPKRLLSIKIDGIWNEIEEARIVEVK